MEVSQNNNGQPAEQATILTVISHLIHNVLSWLIWLFTFTKVDRFKAGIDTSGEGRDDS